MRAVEHKGKQPEGEVEGVSTARQIPDSERTARMLDLVRQLYPPKDMSLSHVVIEEVAPGTGWSGTSRWADVLALGVWPSKGLTLDGFEIKASRADLRRELADLEKHRAVARYCTAWWLVVWNERVIEGLQIPEDWGVMVTAETDWEERELKVLRPAPKREPEAWPRSFTCSLVRNAYQQSPGAAYVARACGAASRGGRIEGERVAKGDAAAQLRRDMEPLLVALFGKDSWKWPLDARDTGAVMRLAAERLQQGTLKLQASA